MAVKAGVGTKFQYYDSTKKPFAEILDPNGLYGIRLEAKNASNESITFKATGSDTATSITVTVDSNDITVTYVLAHGTYSTSTITEVITAIGNSTPANNLITATAIGDGSKAMFDITKTPLEKYVSLAHITNITGPSMTKDTIDTTALDTVGGYRTFITGFKNAGTLTLTMMFTADGYNALKDFYDNDLPQKFRITLPDKATDDGHGTQLTFDGLVTEIPLTIPPDDKITCDVTVQIVGTVNLAVAN